MTLSEFKTQPKELQLQTLDMLGFVIGEKEEKDHLHVFYCLEDFFVEMDYKDEAVESIKTFRNPKHLRYYYHNKSNISA
ncbi:hypothetical protein [Ferruginibacter albus]|uniref:hypothetical protein n=1 Tax=Ferruginibacter albus TaxID=2875540 RepID=UPI001CC5DF08|nr:hypothetical protein [Ferruginibacter albus]UAY53322.1 hypothetical protein K9M53_06540 [Ferruginibacter albus]